MTEPHVRSAERAHHEPLRELTFESKAHRATITIWADGLIGVDL
jgi:hypothetical protein